jgi:hypothetical protein
VVSSGGSFPECFRDPPPGNRDLIDINAELQKSPPPLILPSTEKAKSHLFQK